MYMRIPADSTLNSLIREYIKLTVSYMNDCIYKNKQNTEKIRKKTHLILAI